MVDATMIATMAKVESDPEARPSNVSRAADKLAKPLWSCRTMLTRHAHYDDGTFPGDSIGFNLGQQLNFIFKKYFFNALLSEIAP